MDMMRRRSEPGLSPVANEAEENRGERGEERQQVAQALTDGREVAVVQQTSQAENEVVPVPAANLQPSTDAGGCQGGGGKRSANVAFT